MNSEDGYKRERQRLRLLSDLGLFTSAMFVDMNKSPYLMGRHHERICGALEDVLNGRCNRLIINIAPRYGKTLLVSQMFIAAGFALNPRSKFLHLSYSRELARANAMAVREICLCDTYRLLFGDTVQIVGKSASNWATSAGGKMYAVSSGGQVTGFGAGAVDDIEEVEDEAFGVATRNKFAGAIVIDDPLKPDDALSDKAREFVNNRFENTIRSRANSRHTPIVIIMQRLHESDLCGYLMRNEPDTWKVLSLPCIQTDETGRETALWQFKHTLEELRHLQQVNPYVFDTQYMQNPTPLEGLMYNRFRTYAALPVGRGVKKNYTDTADTGKDYLCSIDYIEYAEGLYVTNVLYTDKPMEYTEPETARMLVGDDIEEVVVESNNGGRGFRRNVERNVRSMGNSRMRFIDLTQSQNKLTRIFTHSAEVQNIVFFPEDWDRRFPLFSQAMRAYRKVGSNAHDDAPDAVTGMVERMNSTQRTRFSRT